MVGEKTAGFQGYDSGREEGAVQVKCLCLQESVNFTFLKYRKNVLIHCRFDESEYQIILFYQT